VILLITYGFVLVFSTYYFALELPVMSLLFFAAHILFPISYYSSARDILSSRAWGIIQILKKLVSVETYHRPTVTVIIPSHNCFDYLRDAVDSALASVGVRVSVLIIDDQSTDGSRELALKLAEEDSRVEVIVNHKTRGAYFCRNIGLQLAKSEFIAFLDSDDWQDKERLKRQISPILLNRNIYATYCLTQRWAEDMSVPVGIKLQLCHISAVFRRNLIEKVGYFDTVRFGADTEFRSRLISVFGAEGVQTVCMELYRARIRPNSLTSSGPGAHLSIEDGKLVHTPNETRYKYRDSYRFWHSQEPNPFVPFPLAKRVFSVELDSHNTSPFLGEQVIGFMSAISNNHESLSVSISSILPQLDVLHVIVSNATPEIDNAPSNKIEYHVLKNGLPDQELSGVLSELSGYILLLDQSLEYPANYVARLLTEIEIHDRQAIVGSKALILPIGKELSVNQETWIVLHETMPSTGKWVDFLGSGTSGFHSQTINLNVNQISNTSTDNYVLATQALSARIPMLSISRPKRWIRKTSRSMKDLLTKGKPPTITDEDISELQPSLGSHPRSLLMEKLKES